MKPHQYAEELYNVNNIKNIAKSEFIIKSSALQSKFDKKFWQLSDRAAFEFVLDMIIKNKFNIKDILFILSEKKLLAGFNEYILDYIASKEPNEQLNAKRLESLAKQKQIDAIIQELINNQFYKKSNNVKEK